MSRAQHPKHHNFQSIPKGMSRYLNQLETALVARDETIRKQQVQIDTLRNRLNSHIKATR